MRYALPILFLLLCLDASAQQLTLSGKITDKDGKPVPFASVYVKGTTKGTSANIEGEYSLKLQPGDYEVLYRAVGFKQLSQKIGLDKNTNFNATLAGEIYELGNVTVSATGEDPAYAIIRKAIRRRKAHLSEVKAYTCEVYIKGLQKLLAAPKKFMGFDIQKAGKEIGLDSNRRGIVYLSESESKLSYKKPGD